MLGGNKGTNFRMLNSPVPPITPFCVAILGAPDEDTSAGATRQTLSEIESSLRRKATQLRAAVADLVLVAPLRAKEPPIPTGARFRGGRSPRSPHPPTSTGSIAASKRPGSETRTQICRRERGPQ